MKPIQSMTDETQKPGGWSVVRQQLATWDQSTLLALVKDLYDASVETQQVFSGRVFP